MESSWLLTESIEIELERIDLKRSGMSWIEIKNILDSKYRESSKKYLFQCDCCKATTLLVLNKEKACHFKHRSSKECAGSRNYKRYTSSTNTFESHKHRVGKSIIKDQLKSNLSLLGAKVTDGYLYKEELSFIPDIIVEWPSGEVWSFDYVTGTGNPQYQQHLLKKQATYRAKNFKSYFLFDHSQVALKKEQHALALSEAEKGSLQFLPENKVWQGLLEDLAERFGEASLTADSTLKLKDLKVHHLLYVTEEFNGVLYKISQLEIRKPINNLTEIPDRWFMIVGKDKSLSISELFSYNRDSKSLVWESLEVSSEELNEVANLVDIRYQTKLKEEKIRKDEEVRKIDQERLASEKLEAEKLQKYNEQQERLKEKRANFPPSQFEMDSDKNQVNRNLSLEEKVSTYNEVLERMRNSERIKTSPLFFDRIKECEADIKIYKETNEQPSRLYSHIEMMKNALQSER